MGIKNINPLLKKQSPDAFFDVPIETFSGKRLAVDANNWMYVSMANARKRVIKKTDLFNSKPDQNEIRKEWLLSLFSFLTGWLYYGVTPVLVFDGKHPVEKEETKAKRKDTRTSAKQKIQDLYQQLENVDLEFPGDIVEKLRKELCNYTTLTSEDFDAFRTVCSAVGVPCLQAEGDGEKLCSSLCTEGKVAAVFSTDTDNLVYGCPLLVTAFSDKCSYDQFGHKVCHVDCVRFDKVLEGLGVHHSLFVDLCIMSGCDYNTNIPGIAAVKALTLLKKHRSIDNLKDLVDISHLKHERCRELFKYVPSEELTKDSLKLEFNKEALLTSREVLDAFGLSGELHRFVILLNSCPAPSDGLPEKLGIQGGLPKSVKEIQTKFLTLIVTN